MLLRSILEQIRSLLAAGLTQREIERRTGVARNTIAKIARGTRPDYEARRREREARAMLQEAGPVERCPGCGAKVQMPCLACRINSMLEQKRWDRNAGPLDRGAAPGYQPREQTVPYGRQVHDRHPRHGQDIVNG